MLKRIITAAVGLALFLPTIFLAEKIPMLYIAVIALLSFIAEYEICGCFGVKKALFISIPTFIFSLLTMAYVSYFVYFVPGKPNVAVIVSVAFLYVLTVFAGTMFSKGKAKFSQAASTVGATLYVLIGFASMILLRYLEKSSDSISVSSSGGLYFLLLIFIGVWLTDAGAYFIGSAIGKHKLIPDVSPKKTVEGAIGGVIGCIIGYMIYGLILRFAVKIEVNFIYLVILAVIVSIIDQIGDLVASFMKREHEIKDFGNLFPGHGGVMDRFDSSIAVAPVLFFVLYFVGISPFGTWITV